MHRSGDGFNGLQDSRQQRVPKHDTRGWLLNDDEDVSIKAECHEERQAGDQHVLGEHVRV